MQFEDMSLRVHFCSESLLQQEIPTPRFSSIRASFVKHFKEAKVGSVVTIPLSLLCLQDKVVPRLGKASEIISACLSDDGQIVISRGQEHFIELCQAFGRSSPLGLDSCLVPVRKVAEAPARLAA